MAGRGKLAQGSHFIMGEIWVQCGVMPTPFMHLQIAERIRADERLQGEARRLVEQEWPAFYLGSVAADVQTVNQMAREKTHFYGLPPDRERPAHEVMLAEYPALAEAGRLRPGQAVFVAAYAAHLMLDLSWYWQVLTPYFFNGDWGETRYRFLIHNTLLTYLDRIDQAALPATAGPTLAAGEPADWLPFVSDDDLRCWRDMLVAQLRPGALSQTVEIYARRLGMTAADFAANLDDPAWMEVQVFRNVPLAGVRAVLDEAVGESVALISEYLKRET
jgi:hypothetical protein